MGNMNEHRAFLVTEIKKTITEIVPSIDMPNSSITKRRHILDAGRVSIIANHPTVFPPDPELNEIVVKDHQFWIYSKVGSILDWRQMGGPGSHTISIPAENVIEDSGHRFVDDSQTIAINELVLGSVPASKIIQTQNHRFLNDTQVNALNNMIDGIIIDGGDLPNI